MEEESSYKDFTASEAVVPGLTIAVDLSGAFDYNVFSAPLPEGDGVLEGVEEVVGLPVCDIICKLLFVDRLASGS
jgi:hypothetical protein